MNFSQAENPEECKTQMELISKERLDTGDVACATQDNSDYFLLKTSLCYFCIYQGRCLPSISVLHNGNNTDITHLIQTIFKTLMF